MKQTSILLLVMAGLITARCVPDPLPVTGIPALQPRITVSSQILPNQSISVFLSKSFGALDAGKGSDITALIDQIMINDAVVFLEHESRRDTLRFVGQGVYVGTAIRVQYGLSYTLRARSLTLGEVSSTVIAPRQVPFSSVQAKLYATGYDSLAQVAYSLQDPPEKNWYMVNVQKFSKKQQINSLLNPRVFIHLIKDDDFNDQTFQDEFTVFFQNYSRGDTVAVFMSNISPEYFKYLSERNDSRYGLGAFGSEPLNFPSNVEGGYGYFNLHVPDVRVFVLR